MMTMSSPNAAAATTTADPDSNPIRSTAASGTLEERLAATLQSQHFSVASYLNQALSDANDPAQRMAELALQLQLQTAQCHEEISKIGAELQAVLPRCHADVGRLSVGLEGLRADAAALTAAAFTDKDKHHMKKEKGSAADEKDNDDNDDDGDENSPSSNNVSSLETLSILHALTANLTKTKEVLTAAATWDTTYHSMTQLLAQQKLPEAVQALAVLENGERALRGMPHPEERELAVKAVRKQVSALLQPQLQHAVTNMHTRLGPLQQCVALYQKLNEMDTLVAEYVKHRPSAIHKAWFDCKLPPENAALAFLEWLPTWLDSVLDMIAEERRQSTTIFGPALVPYVMIKVFKECFRPLLPSFQSRLQSASLETSCTIFESVLQFLSLAYENIASAWLDLVEAGSVPSAESANVYHDIMAVVLQVTSPFTKTQESFCELESKNCKQLLKDSVDQIRAASNDMAADTLSKLCADVFPVAASAVARFELLTAGYNSSNALTTIDKVLETHVEEVAVSIRRMSVDTDAIAESFDEPHVLSALEFLLVAGNAKREMNKVAAKTRERLDVLRERMAAHSVREKDLEASGKSFQLPESVSPVEIDSLVAKAVYASASDIESNASYHVLQRLASTETATFFPAADEALARLAQSCQKYVFDVLSAVPTFHLRDMSSMPAWKESASADDLNSYGTLPQQFITHVGEHMLALVQALEPFACDKEVLSLANEAMVNVRSVALQTWEDFVRSTGSYDDLAESIMDGKQVAELVVSDAVVDDEDDDIEEDGDALSAAFCNAWLDAIGLAVAGRVLERVMRIPALTPKGCEHLNSDLNYLVNVFSALGVSGHPHPLLGHVAALSVMEINDLQAQLATRHHDEIPLAAVLRSVEERLLAIRNTASHR